MQSEDFERSLRIVVATFKAEHPDDELEVFIAAPIPSVDEVAARVLIPVTRISIDTPGDAPIIVIHTTTEEEPHE